MAITEFLRILTDTLAAHQLRILFMLLFYVYGSIPFAFIFTYAIRGEIIYEKRTRNVGVANTFLVGGLTAGFLTAAGESSKALLPMLVANFYFNGDLTTSLALILSASVGTSFSVFLGGKGGMGSTILIWTLLILTPLSAFVLAAIWGVTFKITRDSYRSSLAQHFSLPVVLLTITSSIPLALFGLLKSIIYFVIFDRSRDEFGHLNLAEKGILFKKKYIVDLMDVRRGSRIGKRASELRFLMKNGFKVPQSYVCDFAAYEQYLEGNKEFLKDLRREINPLANRDISYSVMPSPNIEDEKAGWLTGQFGSFSSVEGADNILDSIQKIWQSASKRQVTEYLDRIYKYRQEVKMAVILQETAPTEYSGIVFTRNPMNGRDEIIVEAVLGPREALVQERITPERWVYKWGEWIEKADDSRFDIEAIGEVVRESRRIEKKHRRPSYLEWVYDGREIYWLELKEVTFTKGMNFYSNKIPKEFFPGIIKPLIWSVNVPMVNSAWVRLFGEILGKIGLDPNKLAKSFYYRAYFNMGIIGEIFELLGMPREALELLMGFEVAGKEKPRFKPSVKTLKYLPRMISFAVDKITFSRKIERFLENQRKIYDFLGSVDTSELDEREIIGYIDILYKANEEAAYFDVITQLLNSAYNMALRAKLKKAGLSVEKIDFSNVTEKYRDIDPNHHLSILHEKYHYTPQDVELKIKEAGNQYFLKIPEVDDFKKEFDEFLSKFGHLSDSSNDFSSVSWKENPELVLKMTINYAEPETEQCDKEDIHELFKGRLKGFLTKSLYDRAAKYREYKERVSFLFTYGYSLFRPYFLQLGRIFRRKGLVDEKDDIFYLELDEIRDIVCAATASAEYRDSYRKRKEEIERYADIELPDVIYGDDPPEPLTRDKVLNRIKGIAASKGYYRGRAAIVKGLQDFNKVKDGDVLVIPHSDLSWTPLFAKAKAVISESGGILSHSAIVAREYNIPAVVSVKDACKLKENSTVAVDGYNGEVIIMN